MPTLETRRGQRRHAGLVHQSCMKGTSLSAVTTDPAEAPVGRTTEAAHPAHPTLAHPTLAHPTPAHPPLAHPTVSPPGSAPLRLMAVHAHPDDESSKGAATMARYAREVVD